MVRDTRKLTTTDAYRGAFGVAGDSTPATLRGYAARRRAALLAHPGRRSTSASEGVARRSSAGCGEAIGAGEKVPRTLTALAVIAPALDLVVGQVGPDWLQRAHQLEVQLAGSARSGG